MKRYVLTIEKFRELFPVYARYQNPALACQTYAVWKDLFDTCSWEALEDVPFGLDNSRFSLIEHINGATEATLAAADVLGRMHGIQYDSDIIITLGLLHDASKVAEIEPDGAGGARKSELGGKIQHAAYGAMLAYQHGMSLDIAHLIMTHTPLFSTMKPQVYLNEAHLFCNVDLCDADALQIAAGCKPVFD